MANNEEKPTKQMPAGLKKAMEAKAAAKAAAIAAENAKITTEEVATPDEDNAPSLAVRMSPGIYVEPDQTEELSLGKKKELALEFLKSPAGVDLFRKGNSTRTILQKSLHAGGINTHSEEFIKEMSEHLGNHRDWIKSQDVASLISSWRSR